MNYDEKMKTLLHREHTIVFDTETTGLSPVKSSIISIGAIDLKTGDEFNEFSQPRKDAYIDTKALERNGLGGIINDKSLKTEYEIEREFEKFCKDHSVVYLVGYNVGFDINFIYNAGKYYPHNSMRFAPKSIDLMEVALTELVGNKDLYPMTEKEKVPNKFPSLDVALSYFSTPPEPHPHISGLNGALYSTELFCLLKYNTHYIDTNKSLLLPPIYEKINFDIGKYVHDTESFIKHGES